MTEEQAVAAIKTGQTRYGDDEGMTGDRLVLWAKRLGTFFGGTFFAWIAIHVAR